MASHGSPTGRVRAAASNEESDTITCSITSLFDLYGPNNAYRSTHLTKTTTTTTQTLSNPCSLSIDTQTDDHGVTTIQKLEDEVATYKAITNKAKEHLDEARKEAELREAALRKTIEDQTTQLCEEDDKITAAITSFHNIVTTQITILNKELVEMQA